jgi:MFS transporter, MHS family, shikimate and dehydroshikimate transport protein
VAGAVLMAVEHAPERLRGFYGSLPQIGVPAGLLLSTGVFAAFTRLPPAQFADWGWRIPFLLSIVLVGFGLVIRMKILETPAFTKLLDAGTAAEQPLLEVIRRYPRQVILAMGARFAENGVACSWRLRRILSRCRFGGRYLIASVVVPSTCSARS